MAMTRVFTNEYRKETKMTKEYIDGYRAGLNGDRDAAPPQTLSHDYLMGHGRGQSDRAYNLHEEAVKIVREEKELAQQA